MNHILATVGAIVAAIISAAILFWVAKIGAEKGADETVRAKFRLFTQETAHQELEIKRLDTVTRGHNKRIMELESQMNGDSTVPLINESNPD
ncbi:MAG: hypothetical protein F6K41_43450 [Symploca sp. SIO3E6]|nr:hypothetical protein [Caldora sp. SIO3E6]